MIEKQRILCLVDSSGSSYHRVKLYKDYITEVNGKELEWVFLEKNAKEKKYLKEEVQQGDILFFNWMIQNSSNELGLWKKELGIKILYDVDDNFRPDGYSKDHPYYKDPNFIIRVYNQILLLSAEADIVTVSTERLGYQLLKYNPKVAVLYNFLPIGKDQFVSNKIQSDKLKVGICGSVSHYPDWKLLKGAINRIAKNKELSEKIEIHICGCKTDNPFWEEIIKMFTVKKNLNVFRHESLPVTEYMKLYDNLDICLMPLEDIEFSYTKSALKLSECLATNTIPVGAKLYNSKELGAICEAETPIEYEKWLEYLVIPENFKKTLDYITETNLKDNDFEGRIEGMKSVIHNLMNSQEDFELKGLKLVGITYDDSQVSEYEKYDNSKIRTLEQKSWRFEYNPIIDIVDNLSQDTEYLGIFSYKFSAKTGLSKKLLNKMLSDINYKNYDFLNLSRNYWQDTDTYLNFGYKYHPKLEVLLKRLLKHLNIEYKYNKDTNCYSNFFIMKSDLWEDYVDNWVKPALEFMENDPEYFEDPRYVDGLKPEKLKELTGLDHYTYHTFVLERLILFFINNKRLTVKNVI